MGWLHNGELIGRILVRNRGCTGVIGTVSGEGIRLASVSTYGFDNSRAANSRESLLKSRLVVPWGCNLAVTKGYGNMPNILGKLRESGVKVISVDPRYTETAALLQAQWLPIRPGADAAVLIAMAYVVITENLQDQVFLDKYTERYYIASNHWRGSLKLTSLHSRSWRGQAEIEELSTAAQIEWILVSEGQRSEKAFYGEKICPH